MNATPYSLQEVPRLTPMMIPSARLLESSAPLDELWAIKPATDMVSYHTLMIPPRADHGRESPRMWLCNAYGELYHDTRMERVNMRTKIRGIAGRRGTILMLVLGTRHRPDYGR